MKKKMRLTHLTKNEMADLQAGYEMLWKPGTNRLCGCGCHYEGTEGGSSTEENRNTNYGSGFWSPFEP